MDNLPKPLTNLNCDLRDFPFMPLDVVRLRDSDIAALSNGDEFRCAVLLWCASWHQIPAASLPDDDIVLSQLAGFGRVVKEWQKFRNGALRGWIKCSDGRLYHPVVAEKANEAWASRIKYREKKEADRARIAEKRAAEKLAKENATYTENSCDNSCTTGQQSPSVATQNKNVAATKLNVDETNWEISQTTTQCLGDNALIGTVDRDSGQWTVDIKPLNPRETTNIGDNFEREADFKKNADEKSKIALPTTPPDASPNASLSDTTKPPTGSRLELDWQLPKAWGDWALEEQPTWTAEHVRKVAEQFKDHWHAKAGADARKVNWQATWRNWVRRENTYLHGLRQNRSPPLQSNLQPNKQELLEMRNQAIANEWRPPEIKP